ncbi:hypothetical protein [Heyndrickxia sporothermodurans]|nr:hypothetical protein [Heyndrickxia sporothermodurans]
MTQIGNVEEIKKLKLSMETLRHNGLIIKWELPYENLLTRLSASIFFFTPAEDANLNELQKHILKEFPNATIIPHQPANISQMPFKIVFDQNMG